ncbi:MAG: hypothetical protein HS108_10975 [Planctomycetes bacterium]|jgi:hypothetical protein|nr:hypothetical protein [Planctomycetota bacterium]MCL4732104.1 hypothetical protein [Planctomycetota bacterium]
MNPIVVCTYKADDCAFVATCNGFPVFDVQDGGSGMAQLNPYLIGKGNELRFVFTRRGPGAAFSAGVREAEPGEMVSTLEDGALGLPAGDELTHRFDSAADDFRAVLDQARPADAAAMIAFALQYRDAIRAGDGAALARFNETRVRDAARQFGMPPEALAENLMEMLGFFREGGVDVEAADLEALSLCGGKVWEVRRKDGRALLFKEEDGGSNSSAFFAALMPGGPQIVR